MPNSISFEEWIKKNLIIKLNKPQNYLMEHIKSLISSGTRTAKVRLRFPGYWVVDTITKSKKRKQCSE